MLKHLDSFWNEEHSLTALLIALITEILIIMPLVRFGRALELLSLLVFALLLLAGLLAMARHKVLQVVSGLFVAAEVCVRLARSVFGISGLLPWDALFSILSIVGMTIAVLWQIYREGPVTGHRIRGAIAAYLLIAVLFAYSYTLISAVAPGSFNLPAWAAEGTERSEIFFYFSITTLTTAGFGDISAIHPFARSLVMMEALIGQLYPAILIARLVTLHVESNRKE